MIKKNLIFITSAIMITTLFAFAGETPFTKAFRGCTPFTDGGKGTTGGEGEWMLHLQRKS